MLLWTLALLIRAWQPTPVFLPRESHGRRNLSGYWATVHRGATSWTRLKRLRMNKKMNPGVHVSFQMSAFAFIRYISKSEIAGSYSSSILSFFEKPYTVFHNWKPIFRWFQKRKYRRKRMMKQNGTEHKQLMNLAASYTGVLCSILFNFSLSLKLVQTKRF